MRRICIIAAICLACAPQPTLAQEGAIASGAAVYEENCSTCHGEQLRPTGAAPDLKNLGADDRQKFETMVLNGRGQMPSWKGAISDDERAAIWAYIRSRAQ